MAPGDDARADPRNAALSGELSDEEIWAVLAYIKSHWHSPEILDARAEMNRKR